MEEDDPDKMYVLSKRLTIMHFIIGAPILLAVQTTFYFSIAIALAIFVLYLLGALLSLICPCICN